MSPVMRKAPNSNMNQKILPVVGGIAAGAALVLLLAGPAAAQDSTVYVGGSGQPGVQVDLGAIYGGYGGDRRLLMPNSKLQGPVVLRPPGSSDKVNLKKPGATAKRAASGDSRMAATEPGPVTTPPVAPAAPKLAAEPPPPKTKKRMPVETEPLTKESGETAAPPEPPPPPPAPGESTGTSPAAGATAEKSAEDTKKKAGAAMAPPPGDMAAATGDIPPPPPPPAEGESGAGPAAPPAQVAAIAPDRAVPDGKATPVSFSAGSATLADAAKETLGSVAKTMSGDTELRLQIVAYATGDDDNASQARRLSLSRALAVRSYLIDQGIRSTRMDVRALGNKFDAGPGDRVDLIVVNQ